MAIHQVKIVKAMERGGRAPIPTAAAVNSSGSGAASAAGSRGAAPSSNVCMDRCIGHGYNLMLEVGVQYG